MKRLVFDAVDWHSSTRQKDNKLGARRLERHGRRIRLTEAGLAFLLKAQSALSHVERATTSLAEHARLKIGMLPSGERDDRELLAIQTAVFSAVAAGLGAAALSTNAIVDLLEDGAFTQVTRRA